MYLARGAVAMVAAEFARHTQACDACSSLMYDYDLDVVLKYAEWLWAGGEACKRMRMNTLISVFGCDMDGLLCADPVSAQDVP